MKNDSAQSPSLGMTEDPAQLFSQYSPTVHFDAPARIADESEWYLIAEQTVPTSRTEFWSTIKRWTAEPQLVIPPIEKAELLESRSTETVIYRQMVPKRKTKDASFLEVVTYQEDENRVIYRPEQPESLPFFYPKVRAFSFVYNPIDSGSSDQGYLRLEIIPLDPCAAAIQDAKMQYALKTLLHKLFKWCIQTRIGYKKKANHDVLVSKETYVAMYQRMKAKYADDLVSGWTEKTNPSKFVFEDIAIASYLICLWQEENRTPRFVDLGCGNGLLTYLLTSEGYIGYGIDIAERKIWSKLRNGKDDLLRVESLYPGKATFPDADWLIGNHADELVPWIPLIARKSGAHCKFFVIPCCFYGLDGTRNLPLAVGEDGKYKAYTGYIKDIATQCGFECEEDYLRIPSTKNIALVGRRRRPVVSAVALEAFEVTGTNFVPRKSDREKEDIRRRNFKRAKHENESL